MTGTKMTYGSCRVDHKLSAAACKRSGSGGHSWKAIIEPRARSNVRQILMVDYLLRRGRYDTTSLAAKRGGVYWKDGGINWRALVALGLGMFAAMTWIDAAFYFPAYSSFFSNRTHGADFSWLFGLVVGAVVYYLLSATSVRKQALAPPATVVEEPAKG
jgi:cytosine/uracil/thiamine/allantoin permease